MKKNFIVDQGVYIKIKNNCYDLHNDYEFVGCNIMPFKSKVYLSWLKRDRKWVNPDNPNKVVIVFHDISSFIISNEFMVEMASAIQEIGYKDPGDKDLDWLNGEDHFTPKYEIIFRFENDEFIRVGAKIAEGKVNDDW